MSTTQPASLAQIREAAHQRYGHMPIELGDGRTVVLRAPLRMPAEELGKLRAMQQQMTDIQDDPNASADGLLSLMRDALHLVAEGDEMGPALTAEVGEDLSVLQELFQAYSERTQPGEASNSAG